MYRLQPSKDGRKRPWLFALLAIVFLAGPATARVGSENVCIEAARSAADRHNVPLSVLAAISLTETGRTQDGRVAPWPWAVNVEGTGKWFADRQRAEAYVQETYRRGIRSFDVGCFQINYRWHKQAFKTPVSMFDPEASADYAARFLSELFAEFGDWSLAAGAYHSRNQKHASRYRKVFDGHRVSAMHLDDERRPLPQTRRENTYSLMLAGVSLSPGSLFQGQESQAIGFFAALPPRRSVFDE